MKLERLAGDDRDVLDRIKVQDITRVGVELHESLVGPVNLASDEEVARLIDDAMEHVGADPRVGPDDRRGVRAGTGVSPYGSGTRAGTGAGPYVLAEWRDVVDAWRLTTWEAYRTVTRPGRRTRLPESQRAVLWAICERFSSW